MSATPRCVSSSSAAVCVAMTLLLPAVDAQVPPHHLALGSSARNSEIPGLFFVSMKDGTATRVSGLPAKFTRTTDNGGVWSVLRRPDENLVLGTGAIEGRAISMTMVTLAGSAVVAKKNLVVGTIPTGWRFGVAGMSLFPDGKRVLFGTPTSIMGAMSGFQLGIADFDAATPTLTPVRLNGTMQGTFISNAEVSRDGKTAFVITNNGNQDARPFRLYHVDLQSGAFTLAYTEPQTTGGGLRFAGFVAPDEFIATVKDYWATGTPKPTEFVRFKVTGFGQVAVTRVSATNGEGVRGHAMDPVTGRMIMKAGGFANGGTPNPQSIFLGDPKTGDLQLFAKPPAGGWGNIRSIAVHSTLDFYGPTPDVMEVGFEAFPNAGGGPTVGNANFSLTLTTNVATTSATAMALLGTRSLDLPLIGTRLLVDPLLVFPVTVPTPSNPFAMPLPIPSSTPSGVQLYLQWAMCEAGRCRASRGVKVTTR